MISANLSGQLVAKTNNPLIDGVLWGYKWPTTALTYAFPTNASAFAYALENFTPFNATQVSATLAIFNQMAAVSGLTFSAAADPSQGNLRAANVSGIDYQNRVPPVFTKPAGNQNTAEANPPDPESIKAAYGDALFNPTDFLNPVKGNYAFFTIIHEFGHSLGLKHGHSEQTVTGSPTVFPALPADRDSNEFSVMTYRSFIGGPVEGGISPEDGGYAQTLMMLDIAALQQMYGANYATNSGNTVYTFSATTGEMFVNGVGQGAPSANRVFLTIWDGGGTDTYDFSNYTQDQSIDLNAGGWSLFSNIQRANLGAMKAGDPVQYARGNVFNALMHQDDVRSLIENAIGGSGNDTLKGNKVANVLKGNGGNDQIDGGDGIDTAVFQGAKADYTITKQANGSYIVADATASRDGTDTLVSIEQFQFSDQLFVPDAPTFASFFNANLSQGKAISAIYQVLLGGTPSTGGFDFLIKGNLASNFGAGAGPVFNDENIFINVANALIQGNPQATAKFNVLAAGSTIEAKVGSLYAKIIPTAKQTPEGLAFITRPDGIKFYKDVAIERGITSENGPAVIALASLLKIAVDGKTGVGNAVNDLILSVADGSSELPATSTVVLPIETIDGTKYDADDAPDAAATTPPPIALMGVADTGLYSLA